ncbi:hypothetical protein IKE84_00250 [Candidatus Saccharibacteria bacterium]|nr:hypothetical protein [Candidatus Saccharibacteria bacterium]
MQGNNMPEFGGGNSGRSSSFSGSNMPEFGGGNKDSQIVTTTFDGSSQINNGPETESLEEAFGFSTINSNQSSNFSQTQAQQMPLQAHQEESQRQMQANSNFQAPTAHTPTPKMPSHSSKNNINTNLVILSVSLGVIALVAIVVSVWLLVNQSTSTKVETPTKVATTVANDPVSAETFGFYPKKITNPTSDVIYRLGVHRSTADGNGVFGAYINTSNSAVDLYIYWSYIANYYGVTTENAERELATITFDQPVADIVIGETGQSVGGDVLLFLLADGTVEYMPVVKALQNRDFRSYGQLAGVSDVVKFYHVDAVSDTGDWSGYVTTLAQREDGSIIDLQSFMLAVLNNA